MLAVIIQKLKSKISNEILSQYFSHSVIVIMIQKTYSNISNEILSQYSKQSVIVHSKNIL